MHGCMLEGDYPFQFLERGSSLVAYFWTQGFGQQMSYQPDPSLLASFPFSFVFFVVFPRFTSDLQATS